MARKPKNTITKDIADARAALRSKGYTYHEACRATGYSYTHLALVLSGARKSNRLLFRLGNLPTLTKKDA